MLVSEIEDCRSDSEGVSPQRAERDGSPLLHSARIVAPTVALEIAPGDRAVAIAIAPSKVPSTLTGVHWQRHVYFKKAGC